MADSILINKKFLATLKPTVCCDESGAHCRTDTFCAGSPVLWPQVPNTNQTRIAYPEWGSVRGTAEFCSSYKDWHDKFLVSNKMPKSILQFYSAHPGLMVKRETAGKDVKSTSNRGAAKTRISEDMQTITDFCRDIRMEGERQKAEQESKDKSRWKLDLPPYLTDPMNWLIGLGFITGFVLLIVILAKIFRGGDRKRYGPMHIPSQQFDIVIGQLREASPEVEKQPWSTQLYLAKLAIEQSRKAHDKKLSLIGELPKEDIAAFTATYLQPEKLAEHKQSAAHWMPIKIDDAWEKLPDSIKQEFGPGWKSGRPSVLIFPFTTTPTNFPFNPLSIVERSNKPWKYEPKKELMYHIYNLNSVMASLASIKPELAYYPGLLALHGMSIIDGWRALDAPSRGIISKGDKRAQQSKAFVPVNYVEEWHRLFIKKASRSQTTKVQEIKSQAVVAEARPEVSSAQMTMSQAPVSEVQPEVSAQVAAPQAPVSQVQPEVSKPQVAAPQTPVAEAKPETSTPAQSTKVSLTKLEPEGEGAPAQGPQTTIAEEKPKTTAQERVRRDTVDLKPKRVRKDSTRVAIPIDEFGGEPEQKPFSGAELVVVDTEGVLNHLKAMIIKIDRVPELKDVLFAPPSPLLLDMRRLWPEEFRQKPLSFQLYAEFYVSMTWKSDSTLNQNTKPHDDFIRKIWETFKDYSSREENLMDSITFARRQLANEWDKLSPSIKREFSRFRGVPQYAFDILDNVPKDDSEIFSIRSLSPASTPWTFDPPKQSMEGINPDAVMGILVEKNKELASYPHLLEILKSLVIESWMALDPATQQAISPDLYVKAWHDMLLAEIEKSVIMKKGPESHMPPPDIVTEFEKVGDAPPTGKSKAGRITNAQRQAIATANTVFANRPPAVTGQQPVLPPIRPTLKIK